jgi:uncharacterized protein YutE (UPF0331/DUF86 family)
MVPGTISLRVVVSRLEWIDSRLAQIRKLPLNDRSAYFADSRNHFTAESCMRQALEGLMDIGRHILAKGFGKGVSEYKQIPIGLGEEEVLTKADVDLFVGMAGYRNRLVLFYHEVEPDELYLLCRDRLDDIEKIAAVLGKWVRENSDNS